MKLNSLEHLHKCCSDAEAVFLAWGCVSARSQAAAGMLPRQNFAQRPKILAPHRHIISGSALNYFIASVVVAVGLGAANVLEFPARAESANEVFRPPAVPLVTSDPYLSIWSEADHLTDDTTRHWTHRPHPLASLIRVDGSTYRLMGIEPTLTPAMPQLSVQVTPTRSIYEFEDSKVHVTMTFMTPVLPDDLEVLTRPLTYITWSVRSVDGAAHAVSIYDSASSQLVVNQPEEKVEWSSETAGDLMLLRVGTQAQPILGSSGDDHRINWGYAYIAAPVGQAKGSMGANVAMMGSFVTNGALPATPDLRMPRAANDDQPVLAFAFDLGKVGVKPVARQVMIAYDEIYSIKYFGKRLRPYWRRNGATPAELFRVAEHDYSKLARRCEQFDAKLEADLTQQGGARYARIAALAYRQCLAACGIAADDNKQPLLFTKENTSNGDIATVDVIFPTAPMLLLLSPTLVKASLVPLLSYGASPRWKFPYAPHDLGTYPIARGTDEGGEEMPVEESGNMLILCDAIAQEEGNGNFVTPWWPKLTQWATYLVTYGLDPEDQLSTDDFMGHLAHNANLSIKAILGLAAYGDLCRIRGDKSNAEKYMNLARVDAKHWLKAAADDDHSRLAFDKPNTWSQKYNLVWDRLLGLNVFPPGVAQNEVAFYKTKLLPYGLPLDSRTRLTKTDWSSWTATMAAKQADFETLISPIYDYLNHTTARLPLADSYEADDIHSGGMHARSVVGGIYIKMLSDRAMWMKWSSADHMKTGNWAPLPPAPQITQVVATSQRTPVIWRYTTQKPVGEWMKPEFDATTWREGPAGFGTSVPGAEGRTKWDTKDIWLRREFTMPEGNYDHLEFYIYHDEDIQIYVNGVLAASEDGFTTGYTPMEILPSAQQLLKPGAKITIAAHCHQTEGGQYVDIGLANVVEAAPRR
ncbi:MAG: hypothetical protein JWR26_2876 [Pedosphaera sp.]|nr:hypothetical protein [Pedosphaera sp.]